MSPHHPFQRGPDAQEQRQQGERNVGQDLDNIFRLTAASHPAAAERQRPAPAEGRRVTQPDLDAALDMLNRAAKAMDLMQARYQHVETYAKGIADRAEKDIAAAFAQAREWESRAAGSESKLDDLRGRAIEAERRAEQAEQRAEQAERNAKEARDWLECFYDKIVTSFDGRMLLKPQVAA